MKKNKNIFLHIIEEDYKRKSKERSQSFNVSGKAIFLTGSQQKDASVVEQLRKLHEPFAVAFEPGCLEPNNEVNQTNQQDSHEPTNLLNDLELDMVLQKIKSEGQEFKNDKQNKLSMEKDLRGRLSEEIGKRKKAIEALRLENLSLQNSCKKLSQELQLTSK
jgi:hypothetical protein